MATFPTTGQDQSKKVDEMYKELMQGEVGKKINAKLDALADKLSGGDPAKKAEWLHQLKADAVETYIKTAGSDKGTPQAQFQKAVEGTISKMEEGIKALERMGELGADLNLKHARDLSIADLPSRNAPQSLAPAQKIDTKALDAVLNKNPGLAGTFSAADGIRGGAAASEQGVSDKVIEDTVNKHFDEKVKNMKGVVEKHFEKEKQIEDAVGKHFDKKENKDAPDYMKDAVNAAKIIGGVAGGVAGVAASKLDPKNEPGHVIDGGTTGQGQTRARGK